MEVSDATVTARVPKSMLHVIQAMANIEHRSLSAMSRLLLEEAIEARRLRSASDHQRQSP